MKIYLHQFLSRTGLFASKKAVMATIRAGEIAVAGKTITQPDFQFSMTKAVVWKGRKLALPAAEQYFVLNKPQGYVCARLAPAERKRGKRSVFDLLPDSSRLFCVGRLDEDTTGLLILTSDGKLADRTAKPHRKVPKTYRAVLAKPMTEKIAAAIRAGVVIELEENGRFRKVKTAPAQVSWKGREATVTIAEGKKRQVRRTFAALGNKVRSLERVAIGSLRLADTHLAHGEYNEVTREFLEKAIPL